MESCPVKHLRPELEPLPERMKDLPVDDRGYVCPWFIEWVDGKPEFRALDRRKWGKAIADDLCWVCGKRMGAYKAFVIGPMCGVNRTTAEPASHLECAVWSARNCPFLARPHMIRRADEEWKAEVVNPGGIMLDRNPGVCCIWVTKRFSLFSDGEGKPLIHIGDPESVEWYAEGRAATRDEVEESVRTGLPFLVAQCQGRGDIQELERMLSVFQQYLPADTRKEVTA